MALSVYNIKSQHPQGDNAEPVVVPVVMIKIVFIAFECANIIIFISTDVFLNIFYHLS